MELNEQIDKLTGLLDKAIATKADAVEVKTLEKRLDAVQQQADAIETNQQTRHFGTEQKSLIEGLTDTLKSDDALQNLFKTKRGSAIFEIPSGPYNPFERKTTIDSTAVGTQQTGVLQIQRIPGIVAEARQRLFLRNLLTSRPTTLGAVDYVRVNAAMATASMQIESSAKVEVGQTYVSASEPVRTIAAVVPASMQVLDDWQELAGFIATSLTYSVNQREEQSFLFGSGVGNDLHGIYTQATAFNTALLGVSAWSKLEVIAAAIAQISIAKEAPPTFVILNPTDWLSLQRVKTTTGEFLLGNPADTTAPRIWGLDVLATTNMSAGQFLVGTGDPNVVEIRDRLSTVVEISREHQDFFVKNLVMFRCEKRTCLIVKRAGAFIAGGFTTSP